MSAQEVVRDAPGFDLVACGRGVRLDIAWMNGVLDPLGGCACDFCGDPRAEAASVVPNNDVLQVMLCGRDAKAYEERQRAESGHPERGRPR